MADRPPNILLLMSDQHRADAMGCAGNPAVQTPTLDRLAVEGVRFERAYCQGPLCMPARASFLTERYVRDHGVSDNNRELDGSVPTFLHALQQVGYRTVCFGKMHLSVIPGMSDVRERGNQMRAFGFDDLHETAGKGASARTRSEFTDDLEAQGLFERYRAHHAGFRGRPAWAAVPFDLPLEAYLDCWLGRRVARWIDEYDREAPFFAWIGFPGPHSPWDAPTSFVERYARLTAAPDGTTRPDPLDSEPYVRFLNPRLRDSDSDTLTAERIAAVRRAYYGNVTLIDEQIGVILAALERRGMLDNTWIVYTADHGEMLGEHGLLHKRVFYEPSVRVPLVIRPPAGQAGAVERRVVRHIDVPATLRVAAGAEVVPGGVGRVLSGDLAPCAISENLGFAMVATDRWKLVVHEESGTPVALFDLECDPLENRNRVADPDTEPVRAELMAGELGALLSRPAVTRPDARPAGRGGHGD
ncbi:MAG: sulfatase family protein [Dehalococcoidia bacterium]